MTTRRGGGSSPRRRSLRCLPRRGSKCWTRSLSGTARRISSSRDASEPRLAHQDTVVVEVDDLVGIADGFDDAAPEEHRALTEAPDETQLVRNEYHCLSLRLKALERREALFLKRFVTDCKHLVEEEDVEGDLDRDRVREPHEHPGRVVLHLLVDEALELGERENLVEPLVELALRQPGEGAVDEDVVAGVELEVEADPQFDEGRQQSVDTDASGVGHVDSGKDPQERALPASVGADDTEELARPDREGDPLQCLVSLVPHPAERMHEVLLEERSLLVRDPERLRDIRDFDGGSHHRRSAK